MISAGTTLFYFLIPRVPPSVFVSPAVNSEEYIKQALIALRRWNQQHPDIHLNGKAGPQLNMGRSFPFREVVWMPHGVRRSCHAAPPRDSGLARWQENQNNLLQVQGHDNYATRKKPTQPSSHF